MSEVYNDIMSSLNELLDAAQSKDKYRLVSA